jgi:hypothetical protein
MSSSYAFSPPYASISVLWDCVTFYYTEYKEVASKFIKSRAQDSAIKKAVLSLTKSVHV